MCRKLRQVMRRCVPSRLHLRGFNTPLDSSGRMRRLRSLRTRMSSRSNSLRRQGSPDPRFVGSTGLFPIYIAEPRFPPRKSSRRVADWTSGNRSPSRLGASAVEKRKMAIHPNETPCLDGTGSDGHVICRSARKRLTTNPSPNVKLRDAICMALNLGPLLICN